MAAIKRTLWVLALLASAPTLLLLKGTCKPPVPLERQFVFQHLEKTGGSTIREFVADYASTNGVLSFIPCYFGSLCGALLSTNQPMWMKGIRIWVNHGQFHELRPFTTDFDCFVSLRKPDTRSLSHFLYFAKDLDKLQALPYENLSVVLDEAEYRQHLGANLMVEKLHSSQLPWGERDLGMAKKTIDRCTIGLYERWSETLKVLRTNFPFLAPYVKDGTIMNAQDYSEKKAIREKIAKYIAQNKLNVLDWDLYHYAAEKFERQLKGM